MPIPSPISDPARPPRLAPPARRARRWPAPLSAIAALAALPALLGAEGEGCTPPPEPPPTFADAWSPAVKLRVSGSGHYATPAHAALLPDGKVLAWGVARTTPDPVNGVFDWVDLQTSFTIAPSPLGAALPAELTVSKLATALAQPGHTAFCAGQSLTADGQVFLSGGSVLEGIAWAGLSYGQTFGTAWARTPTTMVGTGESGFARRWYPSQTRLPDGRIVVLGGYEHSFPPKENRSAEIFTPSTGAWQLLAPHAAAPPEMMKYDYSFTALLPQPITQGGTTYELIVLGERHAVLLDTDSGTWSAPSAPRPDTVKVAAATNPGPGAAMLPLRATDGAWGYANGSMLVVGGFDGQLANRSADLYDPTTGAWRKLADLGIDQQHPTLVTLPDATVVALAGHDGPSVRAIRIDPRAGFRVDVGQATAAAQRGYHNVAVLLPDGRVLVASGAASGAAGNERADFEYYEPPYLKRPRPVLASAPATLALGAQITLTASSGSIAEAVLIALPSVTHSFDWNGRHVELPLETTGTTALARVPSSASLLPPGYYMLFILDADRTPAEAKIVRVTP
jgi:hypothetical protein